MEALFTPRHRTVGLLFVLAILLLLALLTVLHRRARLRPAEAFVQLTPDADAMVLHSSAACRPGGHPMARSDLLRAPSLSASDKTICMFATPSNEVLSQPGGCSKANQALYHPDYADLVQDISVQEFADGTAGCTITFDVPDSAERLVQGRHASVGRIKSYDEFVALRGVETSAQYLSLVEDVKRAEADIKREQATMRATLAERDDFNRRIQECGSRERNINEAVAGLRRRVDMCSFYLTMCKKVHFRPSPAVQSYLFREGFVDQPGPVIERPDVVRGYHPPDPRDAMSETRFAPGRRRQTRVAADGQGDAYDSYDSYDSSLQDLPGPVAAQPGADPESIPGRRPAYVSFERATETGVSDRVATAMTGTAADLILQGGVGAWTCPVLQGPIAKGGISGLSRELTPMTLGSDPRASPLACDLPSSASVLLSYPGGCSMSNRALYAAEYSDVIEDVRPNGDACTVVFASAAAAAAEDAEVTARLLGQASSTESSDTASKDVDGDGVDDSPEARIRQFDARLRDSIIRSSDAVRDASERVRVMHDALDKAIRARQGAQAERDGAVAGLSACEARVADAERRKQGVRSELVYWQGVLRRCFRSKGKIWW